MSERQARQKRKNEPIVEQKKQKGSPLFGIIATVLILVFLGLGGYALKDNIKAILPERPEKETTVADIAKDRDMTVDEFIEEFGLGDSEVTKKTTESELLSMLTVANYAKYEDKTVDELLAEYEIAEADENMLWQDAYLLMPMSKYVENMGTTFDEFKGQAGLPDAITEKTTLGDAQKIISELQEEQAEDSESSAE
ncbi:MAG: hypothetical protein IK057_04125 [Clostridia bacterium]|nr:hypothetical protein [Clostridia bacterium]